MANHPRNHLPYSDACERNKGPILEVFQKYLDDLKGGTLLEMGHGTGQHAEYFSQALPVEWLPSDVRNNLWMARERVGVEPLHVQVDPNLPLKNQCPQTFDHVFTANTLHIMAEDLATLFCREVSDIIRPGGRLFIYGPFKWHGKFTSESNRRFDQSLRERDEKMGIRDFEEIKSILEAHGLNFESSYDLPANNHLLVFQKKPS